MTKSAVGDWDTDPDANTDIADIPLAENQTFPRHVNNAFREVMAQIADGRSDGTLANVIDEDDMATDSATRPPSQQSVKAYADTKIAASVLTTRGDIIYRNATVPARLAKGTLGQALKMGADDPEWAASREVLTANRTYYVRTDGSDSNTGLADSSGGAFLTIQKAVDVAYTLDPNIYNVTIDVGDGTYSAGAFVNGPWLGSGTLTLVGNTGTPGNCIISSGSSHSIRAANLARLIVGGFKLEATTGRCVQSESAALITITGAMEYGAAGRHLSAPGGLIKVEANYTVSGGAAHHYYTEQAGLIFSPSRTVTLTGTPAFSTATAFAISQGYLDLRSITYSGSATGTRYSVTTGAIINTGGGGASYIPGNASGSATTPGVYL